MAKLDINDHLVVVGNFGRYQWVCLLLTGTLVMLFGMQMFVSIFTHASPNYKCNDIAKNLTSPVSLETDFDNGCEVTWLQGSVNYTEKCESFEYDKNMFSSTIVTDFDLVCERKSYVTIANMAWMGSEGVGAILGSYVSDRFGRKPMIIVTYLIIGTFGSIVASSMNLIMYTIIRCAMGFVCFAGFTASATLLMESVSPYKRSQALNAIDLFWVLGASSLSLWAFLLRNWQHLQLAISLAGIPLGISCFWLLDESPHWLMMKGKTQQAYEVLNKMARWNGVEAPDMTEMVEKGERLLEENKLNHVDVHQEVVTTEGGCCAIWRYRRVVVRFMVYSAGWVACAFCYYALSFGVTNLPGNLYLNSFIMSGVEGLAYVCCFVIAVTGRKVPTVGSYLAGGGSLLISIIVQIFAPGSISTSTAITALSVVGKFCISAAWQIIFVWQTEVYPTTHRCMLTALNGVIGRVGTVLAPYMIDLHLYIDLPNEEVILPSIFVGLMVTVGIMHIIPPETNKRKLPENLHEANQICFPMAEDDEVKNAVEHGVLLADSPQNA